MITPLLVALFTRAWIEILLFAQIHALRCVALFTRAWIEIHKHKPPSRADCVALFTRAWIEMAHSILSV